MAISKIAGKVQTVLGVIESQDVGITVPHEHLLIDGKCIFTEPEAASDRALAYEPVDWHNLSWLRYHPYENLDNMRLLDEQEAIDEAMIFKKSGGQTIVDVTINGIGRDPKALSRISRATGLNVVMGSGYYVAPTEAVADATTFEFKLDTAGSKELFAWWTAASDRSTATPFVVAASDGTLLGTVHKNQQVDGGTWNSLGKFNFTAGWNRVPMR